MFLETQSTLDGWERRGAPRYDTHAEAILSFDGRALDCIVTNISETGAAIALAAWEETPDTVAITMAGEVRRAYVVRRLAPNLALHFTGTIN